jgi:site-specific recombinase XerD
MSTELVDPMASVRAYLEAEKAGNTRRAYAKDWADFSTWCKTQTIDPIAAAPVDVARYLAQLADGGRKVATIQRRKAAISAIYKAAGFEPPTNAEGVKAVMRGIRRTLRSRPVRKAPTTAELLSLLLEHLPNTLAGLRDRAILLVGFAAALRRSELVALKLEDIEQRVGGILLHLGQTTSDQEGAAAPIPVPNGKHIKPVEALNRWISAAGIMSGPVFREVDRHGKMGSTPLSDRSVARIVKRAVKAAGLDEDLFSGHSMRAGFVTTALGLKIDPLLVMKTSRHKKMETLAIYDRRDNDFEGGAGGEIL